MTRDTRPLVLDPAGNDIQSEAARLRERGTVTLVELPGGVSAWAVTRQEALRRLLTDPRVSKDPNQHWPAWIDGRIPEDWPLGIWVSVRNMFTAYGGDHRRLRALVAKAFTSRRTEALRPSIQEITERLLDELAEGPDGRADLREGLAYPLPIEVICRLSGIPDETRPSLRRCVDGIFNTAITPEQALRTGEEMNAILVDLVKAKRRSPGDDMASGLIAARDEDGSALGEDEMVDTLILMISAGHETTVNLLDHAITALLTGRARNIWRSGTARTSAWARRSRGWRRRSRCRRCSTGSPRSPSPWTPTSSGRSSRSSPTATGRCR